MYVCTFLWEKLLYDWLSLPLVTVEGSDGGFRPVSDQFQNPRRDMFGMQVCKYVGM